MAKRSTIDVANPPMPPMQAQERVRISFKGLKLDVAPEMLRGEFIDAINVVSGPDRSYMVAPAGGRYLAYEALHKPDSGNNPAGPTAENIEEFKVGVFKLDPSGIGRTEGALLAAVDENDHVVDLLYFNGEEQFTVTAPQQDFQPPTLFVTAPVKDQVIYGKDTDITITWGYTGSLPVGAEYAKIQLFDESGTLQETIVDENSPSPVAMSTKSYTWAGPVSNSYDGTYQIVVEGSKNTFFSAESQPFTILPSSIVVAFPVSGTTQYRGDDLWMGWYSGGNVASTVKILLKERAGGSTVKTIALSAANTVGALNYYGPYSIPNDVPAATDYFIYVEDTTDANINDDGENFEIKVSGTVTPTLTCITPALKSDGSKNIYVKGNTYKNDGSTTPVGITWDYLGDVGTWITAYLLGGSAPPDTVIGKVLVTTREMNFAVPSTDDLIAAENYYIVLATDSDYVAQSAEFIIKEPIQNRQLKVINPDPDEGNVTWYEYGTYSVVWQDIFQSCGNYVNVYINAWYEPGQSGAYYYNIGQKPNNAGGASGGSFEFTVPTSICHKWNSLGWTRRRFYVRSVDYPDVYAESAKIEFLIPRPDEEVSYAVWSRDAATPRHEIWKANIRDGPQTIPYHFVDGATGYGGSYGTTMPTVRQMITDRDGCLLVGWMDADDNGVRVQQFTGSGLNDMTSSGTFTGSKPTNYRVEIDATGTPDTFKWSDDGGSTWDATGVGITGAAQTLNNGVTVTFAATTGHTLADRWDFQAINDFPLTRIGDTARLIKYEGRTAELIWTCDCAAAIRTLEAAADEVHILEHMAIATSYDRQICVALAGWTLTGATYARKLWIQRIKGSDGTLAETTVAQSTTDTSITGAEQIGLCGIYGASWSPGGKGSTAKGSFWIVADQKTHPDDGTTAYNAEEFIGKIWRFDDNDLTSFDSYHIQPEAATYYVYLGISFRKPSNLLIPVFYKFSGTLDDGNPYTEKRLGLMELTTNGKLLRMIGFEYNDSADNVFGNYAHPGGCCGLERNGPRLDVYEGNWQEGAIGGNAARSEITWLSDGQKLWSFNLDRSEGRPRRVAPGGTLGQGTYHTYNCHALGRLANGYMIWLDYEYQDSTFATTDLNVRLRIAEPMRGGMCFDVLSAHDSSDEPNQPYLPQPFVWYGGPDANGNDTELNKPEFPWAVLAISSPKVTE